MNTGIYYFSGTGNSFAAAKQIAEGIENSRVIAITDELTNNGGTIEHDNVIIIYPSYGYGMPSLLYRFFKTLNFKASYICLIVTYGTKYGATLAHAKRILKKRGVKVNYFAGIKCVENYIPFFGLAKDEKLKVQIEKQRETTIPLIENILNKTENNIRTFKPFSGFVSAMFRFVTPLFAKSYKITGDCTSCGLCRDICPANAITMEEKRPVFNARKCQHCQGCLNWCPNKAIDYVRLHKSSRRYHHPDVTISEMRKRAEKLAALKNENALNENGGLKKSPDAHNHQDTAIEEIMKYAEFSPIKNENTLNENDAAHKSI